MNPGLALPRGTYESIREMGVFDAIYTRRAIRSYTTARVDERRVRELLNAAIQAPSAMNSQPWAFLVIQKPELLKKISDRAKEQLVDSGVARGFKPLLDPKFDIFYGASTLILICAESDDPSQMADCFLAGENLMLAARGMGLGTCPIGFVLDTLRSEPLKSELGIPMAYIPVLPIIAGFPNEEGHHPERRPAPILGWLR